MLPTVIWIYFLGDAAADDNRPTVWVGPRNEGREIELPDRARLFVAALAVPPEMTDMTRGDGWESSELSTWTSAEVLGRMEYATRSAITDVKKDLAKRFGERGLRVEDYLRTEGHYGLTNVRVDAVEILREKDDPEAVDSILSGFSADPGSVGFAKSSERFWSRTAREEVADAIITAVKWRAERDSEEVRENPESGGPEETREAVEAPLPSSASDPPREPNSGGRILGLGALAALVVAAVIAGLLVTLTGGGSGQGSDVPVATGPPRNEVTGGVAHTWSNYKTGEGRSGQPLHPYEEVEVSCRVRGFDVGNGNIWWYRIKSKPWDERFYVTADAFYNDGERQGPLKETPYVDREVPLCPPN